MYDDRGNIIDENNCLVFESESLPDAEHQDLMRIVESEQAQTTGDLFNVLARARLGTGSTALTWLAKAQRLRKYPTDNVELTPDSRTVIGLDQLNKIVKMQKAGASRVEIENSMRNDTDLPPRTVENVVSESSDPNKVDPTKIDKPVVANVHADEGVLDDAAMAASFMDQAVTFEAEAKRLREQAIELDPSLKPKPKRRAAPKKTSTKT
jgi:hypothetical protein